MYSDKYEPSDCWAENVTYNAKAMLGVADVLKISSPLLDVPLKVTLEDIYKGNWYFNNPTPEAREVFKNLGVPLEECAECWDGTIKYVEWYKNKAYTTNTLDECNKLRKLFLLNGELHFATD